MTTYVALLRGINVGGNKKIKMAELREQLTDLGLQNVRTLLQSGNVVFRSEETSREELQKWLTEETEKRLGVRSDYYVRTAEEWAAVIDGNPFPQEAKDDPSHLLVVVTAAPPVEKEVDAVQAAITGPEVIKVGTEHLYIIFPEGIGRSKVDRTPGYNKLWGNGTSRNWNTVLKIAAMAREE
ncbi:MAG: DUF1697 domain-containing protein [Fimbriimonas sp.]